MQEERSFMSLNEKNKLEKFEEKIVVKYRKYSKKTERVKKTNQMVIVCMSIIKGFLLLGFITQILLGKQGAEFIGIPAVLLGLGLIADWVLYIRDHSSVILKNVILYGFLLVYAILNFMNGSQFVILYIIPPLFCCMLYYHKQFNASIVIIATAILVIRAVKDIITVGNVNQSEFMMIVIAVMAMLFFQWSTRVLKQFDHDAIHTMRDEQKRQSAMMKDILGVADTTRGKVEETSERMMSLKDSTSHVNQSLHEIAQGILSTAESIQEQSEMTGEIQKAVSVAKENTIEVVKAAQNSSEQMSNNSKRMEILRNQSEDIESVERDVQMAMNELKAKAEEVSEITKVIFSISDQTTLLALNASIESARAGEAGKGFAVVADQIRDLSDQTKKSTEQIEQIVNELNNNADLTANLIERSKTATNRQKDLIEENVKSFDELSRQSEELSGSADNLEREIERLFESNNRIVESITQLSAVSEEVTASTQEASNMSENDMKELDSVAASVRGLQETVEELKKYNSGTENVVNETV